MNLEILHFVFLPLVLRLTLFTSSGVFVLFVPARSFQVFATSPVCHIACGGGARQFVFSIFSCFFLSFFSFSLSICLLCFCFLLDWFFRFFISKNVYVVPVVHILAFTFFLKSHDYHHLPHAQRGSLDYLSLLRPLLSSRA